MDLPQGAKRAQVPPVLLGAPRCWGETDHALTPTHLSPHAQGKNAQILLIDLYTLVTFSCLVRHGFLGVVPFTAHLTQMHFLPKISY